MVIATSVTRLPYRPTNALAVSLFLHRWCPACAYHRVRQSGLAIPPVSKIQRQTKLQWVMRSCSLATLHLLLTRIVLCFRLGLRAVAKAMERKTQRQSVTAICAASATSLESRPAAMLAAETTRAATATRKAKIAELATATRTTHAAGATRIAKFIGTLMETSRVCVTKAATEPRVRQPSTKCVPCVRPRCAAATPTQHVAGQWMRPLATG